MNLLSLKTTLLTFGFFLLASIHVWGQAPGRMTYQAVIRNASGGLISNAQVGVQVSILQGSSSGSAVFSEIHLPTTNSNGLATLEIGSVTPLNIDWANGPYFIKVETDPTGGANYTISGTSELVSVPYALHALSSEDAFSGDYNDLINTPVIPVIPTNLSAFTNDVGYITSYTETDPDFNASVAAGITALDTANWNNHFSGDYNDLTNTPVIPTVPTNVSAFTNDAGYLTTEIDGSVTNEIQALSISADTIYLSNGGFVKLPAGFDGQYSSLTGTPTNVSAFTNDAGYLTNETDPAYSASVAAGISALDTANWNQHLNETWKIGGNGGTIDGTHFIGTTDDVPLGFRVNNVNAGKIIRSSNSTYLGYNSGNETNSGHENTGFGTNTLKSLTTGWGHTALGFDVMSNSTTGLFNTAMGYIAMYANTTGRYNTGIGSWALSSNTTGESNAGFGMFSLPFNVDGNYNTSLGAYTGYNNSNGSGNVFIGYQAGYNEYGSNKLYIANSVNNPPLIYGDFSNGRIGLGTTSPNYKLEVNEDVLFNGVRVGRGNGNQTHNTVVGNNSMTLNTTGDANTAVGIGTLNKNNSGSGNTAIGFSALPENTSGGYNTAVGYDAMFYNTTGGQNTAVGGWAMHFRTGGTLNTAFGHAALRDNQGNNNTSIGTESGLGNTSGSGNVFIGYQAGSGTNQSNTLYIANSGGTPLIYGDFSSGRVGIGTTNPTAKFEIKNNSPEFLTMKSTTTMSNAGDRSSIAFTRSDDVMVARIDALVESNYTSGLRFLTQDAGINHEVRIISNGNMGIDRFPDYKLDVHGDINFIGDLRKNGIPVVMDGSETKVNVNGNLTITGTGTTADPYEITANKPEFYLGQDTLGGIVFYIYLDANGDQRGLIVSKTETTGNWSSVTGYYGADRTYDGAYNMPFLTNSTSKDWVTANFSNDWFIPSIDELLILFNARMHVNKALHVGGHTQMAINNSYWSSFEYDSTAGMYLHFSNASTGAAAKATNMLVRAVRRF
jgi:trimeric autotransporter adhesin